MLVVLADHAEKAFSKPFEEYVLLVISLSPIYFVIK